MSNVSNQNSPPKSSSYLQEIRDAVVGIHDILQKNQIKEGKEDSAKVGMHQHQAAEDVLLSKEVVLQQLRISPSTLAKWRFKKSIKYVNSGTRLVFYNYVDLMDALADNRLTARGFNPFAAYRRMLQWYKKNIENPSQP